MAVERAALPVPSKRDLERLARKYQTLGELRRARARGEDVPPRRVFRGLAAEHPGALNELDTLPLEVIDRRSALLSAAAAGGGALEPWMAWLHGYHALLRAALAIKPLAARAPELDRPRALALAAKGAARARATDDDEGGAPAREDAQDDAWAAIVDEAFVRAVARPPGGRINTVVFGVLSGLFGAPASVIQRELFPGLRSRAR